jgi:CheY-like chemotaxis protein
MPLTSPGGTLAGRSLPAATTDTLPSVIGPTNSAVGDFVIDTRSATNVIDPYQQALRARLINLAAARFDKVDTEYDDAQLDMDETYRKAKAKIVKNQNPRVMLVIRRRFRAAALAVCLMRFGCKVVICHSGKEAYNGYLRRKSHEFDLAIVDWDLPDVGGRDLAFYERQKGGTLCFVAALPPKMHGVDSIRSGADLFLRHPLCIHLHILREILLPNLQSSYGYPTEVMKLRATAADMKLLLDHVTTGADAEADALIEEVQAELSEDNDGVLDASYAVVEHIVSTLKQAARRQMEASGDDEESEDEGNIDAAHQSDGSTTENDDAGSPKSQASRSKRQARHAKKGGGLIDGTKAMKALQSAIGVFNNMRQDMATLQQTVHLDIAKHFIPPADDTPYHHEVMRTPACEMDALTRIGAIDALKRCRRFLFLQQQEISQLSSDVERLSSCRVELETGLTRSGITVNFTEAPVASVPLAPEASESWRGDNSVRRGREALFGGVGTGRTLSSYRANKNATEGAARGLDRMRSLSKMSLSQLRELKSSFHRKSRAQTERPYNGSFGSQACFEYLNHTLEERLMEMEDAQSRKRQAKDVPLTYLTVQYPEHIPGRWNDCATPLDTTYEACARALMAIGPLANEFMSRVMATHPVLHAKCEKFVTGVSAELEALNVVERFETLRSWMVDQQHEAVQRYKVQQATKLRSEGQGESVTLLKLKLRDRSIKAAAALGVRAVKIFIRPVFRFWLGRATRYGHPDLPQPTSGDCQTVGDTGDPMSPLGLPPAARSKAFIDAYGAQKSDKLTALHRTRQELITLEKVAEGMRRQLQAAELLKDEIASRDSTIRQLQERLQSRHNAVDDLKRLLHNADAATAQERARVAQLLKARAATVLDSAVQVGCDNDQHVVLLSPTKLSPRSRSSSGFVGDDGNFASPATEKSPGKRKGAAAAKAVKAAVRMSKTRERNAAAAANASPPSNQTQGVLGDGAVGPFNERRDPLPPGKPVKDGTTRKQESSTEPVGTSKNATTADAPPPLPTPPSVVAASRNPRQAGADFGGDEPYEPRPHKAPTSEDVVALSSQAWGNPAVTIVGPTTAVDGVSERRTDSAVGSVSLQYLAPPSLQVSIEVSATQRPEGASRTRILAAADGGSDDYSSRGFLLLNLTAATPLPSPRHRDHNAGGEDDAARGSLTVSPPPTVVGVAEEDIAPPVLVPPSRTSSNSAIVAQASFTSEGSSVSSDTRHALAAKAAAALMRPFGGELFSSDDDGPDSHEPAHPSPPKPTAGKVNKSRSQIQLRAASERAQAHAARMKAARLGVRLSGTGHEVAAAGAVPSRRVSMANLATASGAATPSTSRPLSPSRRSGAALLPNPRKFANADEAQRTIGQLKQAVAVLKEASGLPLALNLPQPGSDPDVRAVLEELLVSLTRAADAAAAGVVFAGRGGQLNTTPGSKVPHLPGLARIASQAMTNRGGGAAGPSRWQPFRPDPTGPGRQQHSFLNAAGGAQTARAPVGSQGVATAGSGYPSACVSLPSLSRHHV